MVKFKSQNIRVVAAVLDMQHSRIADVPENLRQAAYSYVCNMTHSAAEGLHVIHTTTVSAAQPDDDADAAQKTTKRLKLNQQMAAMQFLLSMNNEQACRSATLSTRHL